jgi:hypothetical protein
MAQARTGRFSAERWTIRLAPALGMAAVAASALLMTESEARWAKVFAGPTDQPGPYAWRIVLRRGVFERPLPASGKLHLQVAFGAGVETVRDVAVGDEGFAWIHFERPPQAPLGPLAVTLNEGSCLVAKGSVLITKQRWLRGQRLEGGWCTGHREGPTDLKLGVVDGVVLNAFSSPVVVTAMKGGQPLAHRLLTVQGDGAQLRGNPGRNQIELITDERGAGSFSIRATDMAATLKIVAPDSTSFVGTVPLRAGGLRVDRHDDTLVVNSSVGHEQATVGLLTDHGLVDVRTVAMQRDGAASSATLTYPQWPAPPFWAMVSSEPELDAGNTIGWPILDSSTMLDAHPSRVVPNLLALDGFALVANRLAQQKRTVWETSLMSLVLLALVMGTAIILSNRRQRGQMQQLNCALEQEGIKDVSERVPHALIAVIVVTGAIVAIAWWMVLGYR